MVKRNKASEYRLQNFKNEKSMYYQNSYENTNWQQDSTGPVHTTFTL